MKWDIQPMLNRPQLSILVALTLFSSLAILGIRNQPPTIVAVAATFGSVVSIVYAAVFLFARYAWPCVLFRGWLVNRPDLRGSWKAVLHSDWVDPKTHQKIAPIEAYMVVRQTLTSLSMRLFTDKSRSLTVAHAIESEPDGLFSLSAVYRNSPQIEYQVSQNDDQGGSSSIHHGALLIEVHETAPKSLEGHYWTDRGTRGKIKLEHKSHAHYSSYEEARNALR